MHYRCPWYQFLTKRWDLKLIPYKDKLCLMMAHFYLPQKLTLLEYICNIFKEFLLRGVREQIR